MLYVCPPFEWIRAARIALVLAALVLVTASTPSPIYAQGADTVRVTPDTPNALAEAVNSATSPGTVFRLERGAIYRIVDTIEPTVDVVIAAGGDPTLPRPRIVPTAVTGGESSRPFEIETPGVTVTMRGVYMTNVNENGTRRDRMMRLQAPDLTLRIEDSEITGDAGEAIRVEEDGISIFITDSIFSDFGDPQGNTDEGRAIDDRGNDLDSLVIRNSTFHSITSRILRDGGFSRIEYAEFDQVTVYFLGQGVLDLGQVREAVITNSLFVDVGYEGSIDEDPEEANPLIRLDVPADSLRYTVANLYGTLDPNLLAPGRFLPRLLDTDATQIAETTGAAATIKDFGDDDGGVDMPRDFLKPPEPVTDRFPYAYNFTSPPPPYNFRYDLNLPIATSADDGGPLGDRSWFARGLAPPDVFGVSIRQFFGEVDDPTNYRLVALPGNVNRILGTHIFGEPGVTWRGFRDTGRPGENGLAEFDGSDAFFYRPGRGFWLVSSEPRSVNDENIQAVPLDDIGTYSIPLQDGWNILSNPFDRDLLWSDVQALNGFNAPLWGWDGRYAEVDTFATARSGKAFYVLNEAGLETLRLAYPIDLLGNGEASRPLASNGASTGDPETRLGLVAIHAGHVASRVQVGTSTSARPGRDDHDRIAPPGVFEPVRLRLQNADVSEFDLASDIRPPHPDGHTFSLSLRALPETGGLVTLRLADGTSPPGTALLIDRSTGRRYDLGRSSIRLPADALPTGGADRRLTLLMGSDAYVEDAADRMAPVDEHTRPDVARLFPAHPHPIRTATTLRFALPAQSPVRLEIYDVLGRRVATLVDGMRPAGVHTVQWAPGREGALASGLYFARFEAEGVRDIQRLVLVR